MNAAQAAAERELARLESLGRRFDAGHDGCSVAWRCWGAGPAVVLLHGGSGGWNHWIRNVEALAAGGFTVLAPDMPGYGDSGDAPLPHAAATLAGVLARSLRGAGARPPALERSDAALSLVGFSFGAVVAAQWAALERGRVRRLVLVGAMGLGAPRDRAIDLRPWKHLSEPQALLEAQRHNLGALMFRDRARIDELALGLHLRNTARTRFVSRWISRGDGLADLLGDLDIALHGIWGEQDVTAAGGVANCERLLRALFPAAGFDAVEDAGHWVQYERADEFNRLLLAALRRAAA